MAIIKTSLVSCQRNLWQNQGDFSTFLSISGHTPLHKTTIHQYSVLSLLKTLSYTISCLTVQLNIKISTGVYPSRQKIWWGCISNRTSRNHTEISWLIRLKELKKKWKLPQNHSLNGLSINGGGEVPHIFLTLMKRIEKCREGKNLFSIRLKSCFLTSTSKKINLEPRNPPYQPIWSAVPYPSH